MATSGTVDFNMTAGNIVKAAFKKIGVNAAEQSLQPFEMDDGIQALNLLIKSWQAYNPHLWATTEGVVFLNLYQASYLLGPNGDHSTLADEFVEAEINADASTGDTVLTLKTTLGMTASDYIGVQITNNLRQWSRIVTVDSLTQVTILDPLVDDVPTGNSVFSYTNKINRPLRILDSRRKTFQQPDEIALTEFSRQQYFAQVTKNQNGTPISWYYSPQLVDGIVYFWQPSSTVNQYIKFTFYTPLQDVGDQTNTLYFPQEWQLGIIYNVAMLLLEDYSAPESKANMITQKAMKFFEDVIQFDEEMTSLNIMPDNSRG